MGDHLEKLNTNLKRVEELSQRLVEALANKGQNDPGLNGPGPDLYMKASMAYWSELVNNPAKLMERQVKFWADSVTHYAEAQQNLTQGKLEPPEDNTPDDRRFSNPLWKTHPYFNYVKQQYMISANAIEASLKDLEGLEHKDQQRIEFFAKQMVDLFAPTNFLATNPDALERAVETEGESLVKGLENLVRDIEAHKGEILPTLADGSAFELGTNIATAKGAVIYRNEMMELLQFAPTTETVYKKPVIIFPPWINKYYVMDLRPENSLIRWIVDQGYTLFVVSWKNPDKSYSDKGLEDYIEKGYLKAIDVAKEVTGSKAVNAVGYCIAGTTLSLTLSLLKKRRQKPISSATFFTTLTDFSDQGEFTVFLQDDFVDAIERQVAEDGVLDNKYMAKTFSFLRAKDLIYGPAVRSYMMGEAPPAFDLLYWNGDGTHLPGKMTVQYLRGLCQSNDFAERTFELMGKKLRVSDVDLPLCAIACEADHIAAWKDSYRGVQKMGSQDKTFILSQSGHIAGIINPPNKKKYGHYTNDDLSLSVKDWREQAEFHEGSWWPRWEAWLRTHSGKRVAARSLGESGYKILAQAPGTYVKETPEL